jgi:hypothetical protein
MNHTLETNSKKSKKRTFKILKETNNVAFTTRNKIKTFLEFLRDIFSVLEQINSLLLMIYYLQSEFFSRFVEIIA